MLLKKTAEREEGSKGQRGGNSRGLGRKGGREGRTLEGWGFSPKGRPEKVVLTGGRRAGGRAGVRRSLGARLKPNPG